MVITIKTKGAVRSSTRRGWLPDRTTASTSVDPSNPFRIFKALLTSYKLKDSA